MTKKKDTPQKASLREIMGNYLEENNVKVKDGTDVNSVMRDMMSIILEGALDQEMEEELGYSRYDFATKKRIIAEMVIPRRPCIPAMAIWRLISSGIGKVNLNHRSSKNIRVQLLRTWRKRLFPCMPKE